MLGLALPTCVKGRGMQIKYVVYFESTYTK